MRRLIPQSEFAKNVLTLMTGSTIAQAIPIAISPILTRLYTPEDFGILALFVAFISTFGAIANGRYELAIMLPEKDDNAINIAAFGIFIAFCLSIVLLIIIVFFNHKITMALDNQEIGKWLYLVPLSVLFTGIYNALNYLNNRLKNYKDLAKANVYKSLANCSFQLGLGFLKMNPAGLILGVAVSSFSANLKLFKNIRTNYNLKEIISWSKMKSLGYRYRDFPKFSMWAILANTLSTQLVNILISLYFSVTTLGFLSFAQRMLGMPSALIGGSIGQVFFQQAAKEKQETGKAVKTFNATFKKLVILSVPMFTITFFIVEDIFAFVFSEEWRVAGQYAQILIPFFAIRFIAASLSNLNNIFEKQHIALMWQLGLLFLSIGILYYSSSKGLSFSYYLYIVNSTLSFYYIFLLVILFFVSRGKL